MVGVDDSSVLLSVHILLPEPVERRFERWTEKMPGASWPAWRGHITLVPNFVPQGSLDEVRSAIEEVCTQERPFAVHLATPMSVKDTTRPDYYAVFLTVEAQDEQHHPIHALRDKLLTALESLREDVRPELLDQPFLPHVTLALGLGEREALRLVNAMRAEPLEAEFMVEYVWIIAHSRGDSSRHERFSIPLGGVARAEILRD